MPRTAVQAGAVFVLDPRDGGRARRVPVEVVGSAEADAVVTGELSPTQRVILDAVREGDRVTEVNE